MEASYEAGMMNPEEGELHFDDPGSFMEFLDMEVEEQGEDWIYNEPDHIDDEQMRIMDRGRPIDFSVMDQAAAPPSHQPPSAENAASSRPSLCNNFIDDYKLAEVLKKNGLPKLRIFIVGVLGKSRTKVSLTETRYDGVTKLHINLHYNLMSNSVSAFIS